MGFLHGSASAGALILMFLAWLLANAPDPPERLWPYLVFGFIFIVLLAHIIRAVAEGSLSFFLALTQGTPLGVAAYWLNHTPYRWLEYACWAFTAVYVILLPRMIYAVSRTDARASGAGRLRERQRTEDIVPDRSIIDIQDVALAILIIVGISGLIMTIGLVVNSWGALAGIAAFLLWPITLLAVPWYAAFAHGDWPMLAIIYGGVIIGILLYRRSLHR